MPEGKFTTHLPCFHHVQSYSVKKMENEANANPQSEIKQVFDINELSDFRFRRLLSDNRETKTVVIEGCFDLKSGTALLILEKESFETENLKTIFQEEFESELNFRNEIYYSFRYIPKSVFNGVKVTLIYPATEKHIRKYEFQPVHLIEETPELYKTVTLPFLKSEQFSLQWVFNILEHTAETDRIVFDDPDPDTGFVLLPDLKWDGKTVETLYLLAIPYKRDIMSLRDLTAKHLPLLKNIHTKGLKLISERYSVPSSQLRVYLHYQPSFYHLHVHFTHLQYNLPSTSVGRAHLLTTVINNLQLISNYYQIANLNFIVKESDNLFLKYAALSLVNSLPKKV